MVSLLYRTIHLVYRSWNGLESLPESVEHKARRTLDQVQVCLRQYGQLRDASLPNCMLLDSGKRPTKNREN